MKALGFVFLAISLGGGAPVWANLIITPTFDSSISGDPNSAAIETAIIAAINVYESDFSNPINVQIEFREMSSPGILGESDPSQYAIPYSSFSSAYQAQAGSNPVAQQALAANTVPTGGTNPVNNASNITLTTANIAALGITCSCPPLGGFDGIISLNTAITFPPNPNNGGNFSLEAVVDHEIDEVLGLGSGLRAPPAPDLSAPMPEDLFRYDQNGLRTYTHTTSVTAFFSINGTTDLAQFDNQGDGGDFGDWRSNPLPTGIPPEVQDAFATAGATPSLGVELVALQAIGFDEVPEPSTAFLFGAGLAVLFGVFWRRRLQE